MFFSKSNTEFPRNVLSCPVIKETDRRTAVN